MLSTSNGRGPGRPRGREGSGAREELLRAATEVFLEKEYDQTTTREIASRAGVNPALIRYYFGSKQVLYETTLISLLYQMLDRVQKECRKEVPNLKLVGREVTRFMLDHPRLARVLQRRLTLSEDPVRDVLISRYVLPFLNSLDAAIEKLQRKGYISSDYQSAYLRVNMISLWFYPVLTEGLGHHIFAPDEDSEYHRELLAHTEQFIERAISEVLGGQHAARPFGDELFENEWRDEA